MSIKHTTNEDRYFLEPNFASVNKLFVLVYTNDANNAKIYNSQKYYLQKGVIRNYNVTINGKKFYDEAID